MCCSSTKSSPDIILSITNPFHLETTTFANFHWFLDCFDKINYLTYRIAWDAKYFLIFFIFLANFLTEGFEFNSGQPILIRLIFLLAKMILEMSTAINILFFIFRLFFIHIRWQELQLFSLWFFIIFLSLIRVFIFKLLQFFIYKQSLKQYFKPQ